MEAEVLKFRSDTIFKTFSSTSIKKFKLYADRFLINLKPFLNADNTIKIEWITSVTPILREDMLLDPITDYFLKYDSFYFYLLAYFFLNLTTYTQEYEVLKNMFFTFEEERLTGEWDIFNRSGSPYTSFKQVLATYGYLPKKTKLCNSLIIDCIKKAQSPSSASKTPYARPSGTGTQGTGTQRARPSKLKGPSGSIKQRAGQNKSRPKKTHKKRQNKHKKRHNKSKKLI